MRTYLGEQGTEQFTVETTVDGKAIQKQAVHDPFIHNTTVVRISRWDLFRAIFRRQFEIRICMRVDGSQGAQRAIMTLDPLALDKDTQDILEDRRISRESQTVSGHEYVGSISAAQPTPAQP